MDQPGLLKSLRTLRRFLRFVVPHVPMIMLAVGATLAYAAMMGAGLLLLKPIVAGMTSAGHVSHKAAPAVAPEEPAGEPPSKKAGLLRGLGALRRDLAEWVTSFRSVRALRDYVGPGENQFKHVAFLIVFLVAPLWGATLFLQDYASGRVTWAVMADLRQALFRKLSHLPLSFFARRQTGDLISRVTYDVATTKNTVRLVFDDVLLQPAKVAMLLTGAMFISWRLTIGALIVVPMMGVLLSRVGRRIRRHGLKALSKIGDITESLNQMFGGIRVVKAFNMEEEENVEFRERNRAQLKRAYKLTRSEALGSALPQFLMGLVVGGVLLLGNHMLNRREINFEDFTVVAAAFFFSIGPIKRTAKCYNTIQANMGALERIFELIDQEGELVDAPDAADLQGVREGIRFRNVWFAYRDGEFVLRDVDLYVPVGKVCAIVGETGAGKSTMLDLIPRFYDATRGAVEIDGVDVRRLKHKSVLKHIAIVSQSPFLFNRSVAENICYGRRDATVEEMMAAAEAAKVRDFVGSMPEKFETLVGEGGVRLSGGERQRVTIARALLKNAPLLMMDEATSSLDNESERLVQRALKNLMEGRTTFVIAHRLSTVRFADMIVVLKAGQIVEKGSHDELVALDGEYARLYRMQFEEVPADEGGAQEPEGRRTAATVPQAGDALESAEGDQA